MDERIIEEVRPLYMQLQGSLSQLPLATESGYTTIVDPGVWEQFNATIDELVNITGEDFSSFKISTTNSPYGSGSAEVGTVNLRQKMGGLISRLYGKYFHGEPAPFGGTPSTVITNSQQQTQNTLILDIRNKIDQKLPETKEGSKQQKFLESLKVRLGEVSNVAQVINLIASLAQRTGLKLSDLQNLFS